MLPSVVTSEVQRELIDYLRTTFHLRDSALETELFRFLQDGKNGMSRGPYLDVRLPFRKAPEDWHKTSPLDYGPSFVPYRHQLRAFERLSARDRSPQNTIVTTGTGSGKTECFLFPLLDHCRRATLRGEKGIKAIILYPMNALASDQAERLAKQLWQAGFTVHMIKTSEANLGDGIRAATMHRVKGLEFPCMLLASIQGGTIPSEGKVYADEVAKQDHIDSERRLLFVAATRALDELVVTGYGKPSSLLG